MTGSIRLALPNDPPLTPHQIKCLLEIGRYAFGADDISAEADSMTLLFEVQPDEASLQRNLGDLLRNVRFEDEGPELERPDLNLYAGTDPVQIWQAAGDLRALAPGQFAYSGELWLAIERLDQLIRRYALDYGAREESYPATIQTRFLQNAGYVRSFPQHVQFVAPLRYRAESLEQAVKLDFSDGANREELVDHIAAPVTMLAPTVCHHCFAARYGHSEQETEMITASGICHRHEGGNTGSMDRLATFRMRELIFIGSGEEVKKQLDDCLIWLEVLLRQLGAPYRTISATDPFFGEASSSKRMFQAAAGSKREVCLFVPSLERWISIGSFNLHGHGLVESYGISHSGAPRLQSACAGIGLERLVLGLASLFGTTPSTWPSSLQVL